MNAKSSSQEFSKRLVVFWNDCNHSLGHGLLTMKNLIQMLEIYLHSISEFFIQQSFEKGKKWIFFANEREKQKEQTTI